VTPAALFNVITITPIVGGVYSEASTSTPPRGGRGVPLGPPAVAPSPSPWCLGDGEQKREPRAGEFEIGLTGR